MNKMIQNIISKYNFNTDEHKKNALLEIIQEIVLIVLYQ